MTLIDMLNQSTRKTENELLASNDQKITQILIVAKSDFAVDGMVSLLDRHRDKYMVSIVDPSQVSTQELAAIHPDMLLINSNTTQQPIEDFIHELHSLSRDTQVLLFGHGMSENYLYQAMRAGARGYLNEKMRGDHLTTALDTIINGGYWAERKILCQFISDKSVQDKIEDNVASLFSRLTNRESEVLELILQGMTTNEIADRIFLSHQGVKAHLTNLFRKFEVKNRAQLIIRTLDAVSPVHSLSELAGKGLKSARTRKKPIHEAA